MPPKKKKVPKKKKQVVERAKKTAPRKPTSSDINHYLTATQEGKHAMEDDVRRNRVGYGGADIGVSVADSAQHDYYQDRSRYLTKQTGTGAPWEDVLHMAEASQQLRPGGSRAHRYEQSTQNYYGTTPQNQQYMELERQRQQQERIRQHQRSLLEQQAAWQQHRRAMSPDWLNNVQAAIQAIPATVHDLHRILVQQPDQMIQMTPEMYNQFSAGPQPTPEEYVRVMGPDGRIYHQRRGLSQDFRDDVTVEEQQW